MRRSGFNAWLIYVRNSWSILLCDHSKRLVNFEKSETLLKVRHSLPLKSHSRYARSDTNFYTFHRFFKVKVFLLEAFVIFCEYCMPWFLSRFHYIFSSKGWELSTFSKQRTTFCGCCKLAAVNVPWLIYQASPSPLTAIRSQSKFCCKLLAKWSLALWSKLRGLTRVVVCLLRSQVSGVRFARGSDVAWFSQYRVTSIAFAHPLKCKIRKIMIQTAI